MPLLKRSSQGVTLTSYGETLLESAKLMQRLLDNTRSAMEEERDRSERSLSIACGYTWWTVFLRDLVFDYRRQYPSAPIQIRLGHKLQCLEQLIAGDVTLFLSAEIEGLDPQVGTHFIPLTTVKNGYFVRQGHALLNQPNTREEILSYPRVITAPPDTRYRRFSASAQRLGRVENLYERVHFDFASNSMAACVDYVREFDGVLEHTQLMSPSFAGWGLVEAPLSEPAIEYVVGLYTLAERLGDPDMQAVVDRIEAAARDILPPV